MIDYFRLAFDMLMPVFAILLCWGGIKAINSLFRERD